MPFSFKTPAISAAQACETAPRVTAGKPSRTRTTKTHPFDCAAKQAPTATAATTTAIETYSIALVPRGPNSGAHGLHDPVQRLVARVQRRHGVKHVPERPEQDAALDCRRTHATTDSGEVPARSDVGRQDRST